MANSREWKELQLHQMGIFLFAIERIIGFKPFNNKIFSLQSPTSVDLIFSLSSQVACFTYNFHSLHFLMLPLNYNNVLIRLHLLIHSSKHDDW